MYKICRLIALCMVKLQMFEVMCVKAWFCQKASAGFVKSGHSN